MAVRVERAPGLRRTARSRAGFVAGACLLYAAGAVSATSPALFHLGSAFLSGGAPSHGEAAPGDHLQTLYHWWLVGHQIDHGHAPWLDPYSFRPEASAQPNYPGWPFGFLFWPLAAAFGSVSAWNTLQLLLYVAAGLVTCAWLRELGLDRGAALAGGLAFAIAPYRVQQSVGHLLGPISILLAVALWGVERARRGSAWWLAVSTVSLASIPLSGQVHLALGAIPFFLCYAIVRLRGDACVHLRNAKGYTGVGLALAAAVGAGILVRQTVIKGSTQASGRSLNEVSFYSARWGDFVARNVDHARSEQYVYLGWVTPLLALAGLVVLVRSRRFGLAAILALGTIVPILFALGTHLPVYSALWHALPPFRFPRVPERLLPIACLCIAGLVAFAVARARSAAIAVLVVALLFVDLHARVYGRSAAGSRSIVADVRSRMLELPVFDPGVHYGSVYLWYETVAQVERPGGYSTTAPLDAKATSRRLERLNCGDWSGDTSALVRRLGVQTVALHLGLFLRNSAVPNRTYFAWRGLVSHGWTVSRRSSGVWVLVRGNSAARSPVPAPTTSEPVFCQGWYGDVGNGRFMSETHAPFWLYGSGTLTPKFAQSQLPRRFTVDGRRQQGPTLHLGKSGWHVITVSVPRLVLGPAGKEVGLRLIALAHRR
jgi:hypothetical protein